MNTNQISVEAFGASATFKTIDEVLQLNRVMPDGTILVGECPQYGSWEQKMEGQPFVRYDEGLFDRVMDWHARGCTWGHGDNHFLKNTLGQTVECWTYGPSCEGAPELLVTRECSISRWGVEVSLECLDRGKRSKSSDVIWPAELANIIACHFYSDSELVVSIHELEYCRKWCIWGGKDMDSLADRVVEELKVMDWGRRASRGASRWKCTVGGHTFELMVPHNWSRNSHLVRMAKTVQ